MEGVTEYFKGKTRTTKGRNFELVEEVYRLKKLKAYRSDSRLLEEWERLMRTWFSYKNGRG